MSYRLALACALVLAGCIAPVPRWAPPAAPQQQAAAVPSADQPLAPRQRKATAPSTARRDLRDARDPLHVALSGPGLPLQLDRCTDHRRFANRPRTFEFATADEVELPAGTRITFSASNGTITGAAVYTVPEPDAAAAPLGWVYPVTVRSDAWQGPGGNCLDRGDDGVLMVQVETPSGHVTTESFPLLD